MVEFAGLVIDAKDRSQARVDFVNFGAYFGNALQNKRSLSFEIKNDADDGEKVLLLTLTYDLSSYSADGKIKVNQQLNSCSSIVITMIRLLL